MTGALPPAAPRGALPATLASHVALAVAAHLLPCCQWLTPHGQPVHSLPLLPLLLSCRRRCVNLEAQIVSRLPDAISNPEDAAKALAVAEYYFYGRGSGSSSSSSTSNGSQSGGGLEAVLLAAFDFDVAGLLQRINSTRQELLQVGWRRGGRPAAGRAQHWQGVLLPPQLSTAQHCRVRVSAACCPQEVEGQFSLQPLLAAPVEAALELSYAIEDHIAQLLAAASRDAVLPGEPAAGMDGCSQHWG